MSEFLRSEIVQKEMYDMQMLYKRLSTIVEHLKTLDKEEKIEFIEQTKILIEKQKIFYTRMTLAAKTDEELKEIVINMNKLSKLFCGEPMMDVLNNMTDKLNSYIPT